MNSDHSFIEGQVHPAMLMVIDVLYQFGCWLEAQEAACTNESGQEQMDPGVWICASASAGETLSITVDTNITTI
jgi:hypothetical protein